MIENIGVNPIMIGLPTMYIGFIHTQRKPASDYALGFLDLVDVLDARRSFVPGHSDRKWFT